MDTKVEICATAARQCRLVVSAVSSLAIIACSTDRVASPAVASSSLSTRFEANWNVTTDDGARILRTVTRFPSNQPFSVAVRNDGTGLTTHPGMGLLSVVDAVAQGIPGVITVKNCPAEIAFAPGGATAYVEDRCDRDVAVVDVATRTQVDSIDLGFSNPQSIVVDPTGAHVYVGTTSGEILSINPSTRAIEATLVPGGFISISDLAVDAAGGFLYASSNSLTVYEIDLATFTIRRPIITGGNPLALSFSSDGKRLLVANGSGYLSDVDLATGQLTNVILPGGAGDIVSIPRTGRSILTIPNFPFQGTLQMYDEGTRTISQSLALGGQPHRLAFAAVSRTLVVTDDSFITGSIYFIR